MNSRIILSLFISIAMLPNAIADKLTVAEKGKRQSVLPHYGILSSFDGTTLIFEENTPRLAGDKTTRPFAEPKMQTKVLAKNNVILIAMRENDPQEAVEANHFEQSVPQKTTDVDLQHAIAQEQAEQAEQAAKQEQADSVFDLTQCTAPGVDQIVERNPEAAGETKTPVPGKIQNIASGMLTIARASDGKVVKYRLDSLSEIRIGICN